MVLFDWKKDLIHKLPKGKGSVKNFGRSNEAKFDTILKSVGVDKKSNVVNTMDFANYSSKLAPQRESSSKKIGYGAEDWNNYFKQQDQVRKQQEAKQQAESNKRQDKAKQLLNATIQQSKTNQVKVNPIPSKADHFWEDKSGHFSWDAVLKAGKKANNEFERFTARVTDPLGVSKALEKKLGDATGSKVVKQAYNDIYSQRKGAGGTADTVGDFLGYGMPAGAAEKGLAGIELLSKLGSKGLAGKVAERAIKGGVTGATVSGAQTGIDAAVNPKDHNLKQDLKSVGENALLGATLDAGLHGAGAGLKKGLQVASNKAMKAILPNKEEAAKKLSDLLKSYHQEQAPLPGKPDVRNASELIPKGSDITNPSYVSKLNSSTPAEVPKLGNATPQDLTGNVNIKEYTLPNGKTIRVKNRVHEQLKQTESKINELKPVAEQYQKEFNDAVNQQYEYLKNSMGKGVELGTTGHGLGNFREVNGSFRVSNNPKWYQDFYRQHGRKPTNTELKQLAVEHVQHGFQDEVGSLPAWQPKQLQEIDSQIEEVSKAIHDNPHQKEILQPILNALHEDKTQTSKGMITALNELPALQKQHAELKQTLNEKPKVAPKQDSGQLPSLDELLVQPEAKVQSTKTQPKADTSHIDKQIQQVTQQIHHIKNQPKPLTKTEIDDQLRSLDINDAYLHSGRKNKQITDSEYWQKRNENEAKRQVLLQQNKTYSHDTPAELKTTWNNETRATELGNYSMKQAYGGGFSVYKDGKVVQKFRTQDEATKFMQGNVAAEKGIDFNPEKQGVLHWTSAYDNASKKWDIQAGDYSMAKGDKGKYTVSHQGKSIGTFNSEAKAREVAQRHYDSNNPAVGTLDTSHLEQQLKDLHKQRESLATPKQEPVKQTPVQKPTESKQTVKQPVKGNTAEQPTNPIETLREKLKPQEKPSKPAEQSKAVKQSENIKQASNERKHYSTLTNSDKATNDFVDGIKNLDRTYNKISDKEVVDFANELIKRDPEEAYQFVKNATKFDKRHTAVGSRLIDVFQQKKEFNRAVDLADILAKEGTHSGQKLQSFSIYNRLSVEGQLIRAQRRVNKINEHITNPDKRVKLTEENIQDIAQAADSIQKLSGHVEQANNVINMMDKLKKGNQLTDDELNVVRSFVSDAKKYIGDIDPNVKPPKIKPVKDVRTRDKVVDFMSKKEDVAKKELQKILGRTNSLPVDAFYHLSVIGASKIAKGVVKLSDFTEDMVKDFGETIRPYIQQIYNKAVETFNLQSESMTRQRLSEVEKITNKALKDKNLDEDQADTIREFARQVGLMSGDAKLDSSMELQSILQDLERPTFGQRLSALQTIAQLLNPKTIVRNAIGNEIFYRVEQMNKLLATPVDILRSKITGGQRTITFRTFNQGQYWRNFLAGAKAGWKGVNPMGLTSMYDLGPQAFRSKFNPLTYMEKALGSTLRSFDYAGYKRAYNSTIGELAHLRAMNEGLKGPAKKEAIARYIREADENMIALADEYGKYATFQDNTVLSSALTKVKKGMNKVSTLGATDKFGLGDLVLKYPKTPGNLVMRALEYSPAGVVRSAHLLKAMAKTKDPMATRDFYLSLTRAITGTAGFSVMGYFLAKKGILTSNGSSDYEVASLEKNAGKQPNSVNISALHRFVASGFNPKKAGVKEGDTFVSYDWAQPISIAVSLGTGVNQSVKENGKLNPFSAAQGAFDSATNTIIQQSVLKGLNDFLANYPGRTFSDRVGDAAKGAIGSFVPTASNQVRQLNDNTTRSTYDPKVLTEMLNRANNRVPSVEKKLPAAYDTLGNKKQTYQNGGNNLFNVLLNPSFVSKYKPSPEAKFVLDYINKTGDKTVAPRMVDKKLDGKPLTGKQYSEMQRILGQEVQKGLKAEFPLLKNETDYEKIKKALDKILRDAGKVARKEIRAERGGK